MLTLIVYNFAQMQIYKDYFNYLIKRVKLIKLKITISESHSRMG